MKKAGSSNSRSKTRRTSGNLSATKAARPAPAAGNIGELAESFAVGHQPRVSLSPQDEALFRAFQSNLLSLISHELRTPLMGILNALTLLDSAETGGVEFTEAELIAMARSNAHRLQRSLAALLDLAAIESGTFHARLREVDLPRLAQGRLDGNRPLLQDAGIRVDVETGSSGLAPSTTPGVALLADPQKVGRAIDLCFHLLAPRAAPGESLKLRISSAELEFRFQLQASPQEWDSAWSQALAGFQGGVASPFSAFAGTVQSEQEFLTRTQEGLGSEFLLVHEIMRLHQGKFAAERNASEVRLSLLFPALSSEEGLVAVLTSRVNQASTELSSLALALIEVPEGESADSFRSQVKKKLFRASDAVYPLPARNQIALVMDDCKAQDAPALLSRVEKALGRSLRFGTASCPEDGFDAGRMLELAASRMRKP